MEKMEEELIEIKSRCSRSDIVKLSLLENYTYSGTHQKNLRLNITIGDNIVSELNWEIGKKFSAWKGSDELGMYITIRPISLNEKGFKLRSVSKSYSSVISFPCMLDLKNKGIRTVPHLIIFSNTNEAASVNPHSIIQACLKIYYEEKEIE